MKIERANCLSHSRFLLTFQNLLTRAAAVFSCRLLRGDLIRQKGLCDSREGTCLEESARVINRRRPKKKLYLAEIAGRSRNTLVTATERARTFNASSPTSKAMPGMAR